MTSFRYLLPFHPDPRSADCDTGWSGSATVSSSGNLTPSGRSHILQRQAVAGPPNRPIREHPRRTGLPES